MHHFVKVWLATLGFCVFLNGKGLFFFSIITTDTSSEHIVILLNTALLWYNWKAEQPMVDVTAAITELTQKLKNCSVILLHSCSNQMCTHNRQYCQQKINTTSFQITVDLFSLKLADIKITVLTNCVSIKNWHILIFSTKYVHQHPNR